MPKPKGFKSASFLKRREMSNESRLAKTLERENKQWSPPKSEFSVAACLYTTMHCDGSMTDTLAAPVHGIDICRIFLLCQVQESMLYTIYQCCKKNSFRRINIVGGDQIVTNFPD